MEALFLSLIIGYNLELSALINNLFIAFRDRIAHNPRESVGITLNEFKISLEVAEKIVNEIENFCEITPEDEE